MNEKRPIPEVVDEKRVLHQRLWMNKMEPIPGVANEFKKNYDRGCG
jgi:hypothetical protein